MSAVSLQFVKLLWSYHILLQFLNHKHFLSYTKAYHFISWGICFSLSKQQSSPIHVSPFHVHTEFNLYIFSTVSFHCCMKNKKRGCSALFVVCHSVRCRHVLCSTQQVLMNFLSSLFFFGGGGMLLPFVCTFCPAVCQFFLVLCRPCEIDDVIHVAFLRSKHTMGRGRWVGSICKGDNRGTRKFLPSTIVASPGLLSRNGWALTL